MHCKKCGRTLDHDARFCSWCGSKVDSHTHRSKYIWLWRLLPVAALIVVIAVGGLLLLTAHTKTVEAKKEFKTGEAYAKDGQYEKALTHLVNAGNIRHHFPAVTHDKEIVRTALKIRNQLDKARKLSKDGKFEEAEAQISTIDNDLAALSGPVHDELKKEINDVHEQSVIKEINKNLDSKKTINSLRPEYYKAASLSSKQGKALAGKIKKKIINLAQQKAMDDLNSNQFDQALDEVASGLSIDSKNERLTSLKKNIEKQQKAFEEQSQRIMEKAIATANKEYDYNKNNAIKLDDVSASINDNNEMTIKGHVVSDATVPVHSIVVNYTIKDKKGKVINEGSAYVDPDTLYPGEDGSFTNTANIYKDQAPENPSLTAEVTKISWYLKE